MKDDGFAWGDYPELPPSSGDSRSGLLHWDDETYKRNFGEAMEINFEMYTEYVYDHTTKPRYALWQQVAMFLGCVSLFLGPLLFTSQWEYVISMPRTARQFPGDGKTHYTFELD